MLANKIHTREWSAKPRIRRESFRREFRPQVPLANPPPRAYRAYQHEQPRIGSAIQDDDEELKQVVRSIFVLMLMLLVPIIAFVLQQIYAPDLLMIDITPK